MKGWQMFGTLIILSAIVSGFVKRPSISSGDAWFISVVIVGIGMIAGWVFGTVNTEKKHAKDCPYESAIPKKVIP